MVRFELGDKISLSPMGSFGHPHGTGRLGYKKLTLFNSSLCLKSLWRCLLFQSLWSDVMKTKYLKNTPVSIWIRNSEFEYTSVSVVWSSFLKVIHWLKKGICWNIGNGKNILIGIDPFIRDNDCPYLPTKIT